MEYVKDWYDIEGKIRVKCSNKNTVLLFNLNEPQLKTIKELDEEIKIKFVVCESLTDLLALPAFLCVVNPKGISKKQLDEHFDFMIESLDDCPYLFTEDIKQSVPKNFSNKIIVFRPTSHFNKSFLKETIDSFHSLTEE